MLNAPYPLCLEVDSKGKDLGLSLGDVQLLLIPFDMLTVWWWGGNAEERIMTCWGAEFTLRKLNFISESLMISLGWKVLRFKTESKTPPAPLFPFSKS